MAAPSVHFPNGRYYALTWSIPDSYGGMTSTLLHRSRAFRELGGVIVEVLTLDDRPDYAELSARLRESGELIDGVSIRNLWDDLRRRELKPAKKQRASVKAVPQLDPAAGDEVVEHDGVVLMRKRRDAHNKVVGIDRFRRDGSLLATERCSSSARSIVLYSAEGSAIRGWSSRWKLYRWWLDLLFKKRLSFLIIDSKTAARFVPSYRREHVVTLHLVHASHREPALPVPTLRASRESVLKRSNDFDAVIVLTERQREELLTDLAGLGIDASGVVRVIPNGINLPPTEATEHRRGEGIIVASLDERKRVELAIDAVVKAHETAPAVTLDIYGEGERSEAIRVQLEQQGAEEFVKLHGYDPDARAGFRHADFSLLTSSSEGLPLVLVESMAAGCIPIAYDIRYGPADIIRDGVSGFLVPEGDTGLLAQRIVELQRLSEAQLRSMRNKAVARAQEFSDEAIAKRWVREFERALNAKRIRGAADAPLPTRLRRRAGAVKRRVNRVLGH